MAASGVLGASPTGTEDTSARATTNGTATTTPTITSGVPANAGDMFFYTYANAGIGADTYTEDPSWTNLFANAGAVNVRYSQGYQVNVAASALSHNPTTTSRAYVQCVMAFVVAGVPDQPPIIEDGADDATGFLHDQMYEPVYTGDTGSINAVIPDFPEDFILGIAFDDFGDPPNDQDWNDWSWAQAPPIDDLPEDFLLGIDDGTDLDDPAYTDWFEYGTQSDPLAPDVVDPTLLGAIEDGNQYGDPSFTDEADYSTYTDQLSDDQPPQPDIVWDGTREFDDPALTDAWDYGTQTDPLSDDVATDIGLSSIDDGTNLPDPAQTDWEDYSSYTPLTPDDVEEQPIAQVWDGTREWEEPSLRDLADYSSYTDPVNPDAPPSPLSIGGDAADEYEDPSFTDWMDYGSIVPPPIPPAPPVPPVVPTSAPCLRVYVNGPPPVSACNLNTFAQTCNVIAELRALLGTPGLQVLVRGTYAVDDGGAGIFVWSATQVGGDDGVNIVFPTGGAATGAWVRISSLGKNSQFLPLSGAPNANPLGGYIYVLSDGTLRYRGPNTDSTLAPP